MVFPSSGSFHADTLHCSLITRQPRFLACTLSWGKWGAIRLTGMARRNNQRTVMSLLLFNFPRNPVHHLADIGQASTPLWIGVGAIAPARPLFPDNAFQNCRTAIMGQVIVFYVLFGVAKTVTDSIRVCGRLVCRKRKELFNHCCSWVARRAFMEKESRCCSSVSM